MKRFAIRSRYFFLQALKTSRENRAGLMQMLGQFRRWNVNLDHTPMEVELPWMSYAGIDLLTHVLTSDQAVFEWGVGGSTLFFARRVARLVSVEHNQKWAEDVRTAIHRDSNRTGTEWKLFIKPPLCRKNSADVDVFNPQNYASATKDYVGFCFFDYASVIDQFPDRSFDIVVVDGRARISCSMHAIPKIKTQGYLILDDADRPRYGWVHFEMKRLGWKFINLSGPGPCFWEFRKTVCWQRPA